MNEQTDVLPMVLITGMAGVGKSELALQYAKSKRDEFKGGIAYLSAANLVEGLQDFLMSSQIAGTKDLRLYTQDKAKAKASWEIWQEFCEKISVQALVVIDDVTDYQKEIIDFLPKLTGEQSSLRLVLTSRTGWENLPSFELAELDLAAAVRMFCNFVGTNHQDRLDGQIATVESLCLRLGCLPLALALTGSWLGVAASGRTLTGLITALEAADLEQAPLEPNPVATRKIAEKGLKAAFQVSWAQLPKLDASAQQLARVLSLFAPVDLSWDLLEKKVVACYPVKLPPVSVPKRGCLERLLDWLRGLFGYRPAPETEVKPLPQLIRNLPEARLALCKTSLLRTIRKNEVYRVHPLLHEFFGLQWEEEADRQGWEMALVKGLSDWAAEIPRDISWEQAEQWQAARPHFEVAKNTAQGLLETIDNSSLYQRYKEQKLAIEAGLFRLNQVPIFERTFSTAKKNHQQAKAALAQGQQEIAQQFFNEAVAGYEEAIKQGRKALSKNSLTLAGYLIEIARLFYQMGHYAQGIPPAQEAVEIAKFKATPNTFALYLIALALLYDDQGEYESAEPLYRRSLSIFEKQLGSDHPYVASSLNNIALLYKTQGKYAEAEPLYRRSLSIREKQLGSDHPDVALSLNNIAELYRAQGKYGSAEPLFRRSLSIREKQLSSDHPDVAQSLNNIALLYESQGKYAEAEPLFRRSLSIREKVLNSDHPLVAQSIDNLAQLYYAQGKYAEAEPLYRRSLSIREKQLGSDHPDVASSLNNLAGLYRTQGKYAEAEPLYRRSLSIREKQLGSEHPAVAQSLNNLALLYDNQGKYAEAEPLYRRSLSIWEKQLGTNHPDVAISLWCIGAMYYKQGKYQEAEKLISRALKIFQQALGNDHTHTQSTQGWLNTVQQAISENKQTD